MQHVWLRRVALGGGILASWSISRDSRRSLCEYPPIAAVPLARRFLEPGGLPQEGASSSRARTAVRQGSHRFQGQKPRHRRPGRARQAAVCLSGGYARCRPPPPSPSCCLPSPALWRLHAPATASPSANMTGEELSSPYSVLLLCLAQCQAAAGRPALHRSPRPPLRIPALRFASMRRHVTLSVAAPDCWERTVLLVNGELSPTLEVVQGEELQVRLGSPCDPSMRTP